MCSGQCPEKPNVRRRSPSRDGPHDARQRTVPTWGGSTSSASLVRHHFEGGKAVYELNEGGHHDHLVCIDCGLVEEFFDPEIESRQQSIAKARGFRLQEHALALYGACTKENCPHRKH